MKKSILTLTVITFITATILLSCKPKTNEVKDAQEKVAVARDNVQDAKDTLAMAKQSATEEEWRAFKNSGDSIVRINDRRIAALKLKIKNTGNNIDSAYQKNLYVMEVRNENLKVKMDAYKNGASNDWQSFKREFKHDTDEIGQALKDLTVDNKK
ncbi:hypothetical protein [Flavobacterium sp.]|uniref:hypothetical protein n=1 Tax=Flavobacterium sp. TaxID=239 RepID=UPI00286DFBD5|nr:hypothetical protein [Flavobacterium sp.]